MGLSPNRHSVPTRGEREKLTGFTARGNLGASLASSFFHLALMVGCGRLQQQQFEPRRRDRNNRLTKHQYKNFPFLISFLSEMT